MKLPPIPAKMAIPDDSAVHQLALAARTARGRDEAHRVARYLERLIDVNEHNGAVAHVALRMLREALGEVEA